LTIGTRGGAYCYSLHLELPAQPSMGSRMLRRIGLGGTFAAVAVTALTVAMGVTGTRLSVALAARSDLPLNADTASDVLRYRMLGSVVANQPLTNELEQEIDAEADEEEHPSLLSQAAFNAGAFEPDDRSLLDATALLAPERFVPGLPDYARAGRFEPDQFQQDVAVADATPLPRRRPKLASLTPFDGLGAGTSDNPVKTAIYDISARAVYMPNGERLEAHSGLGPKMDDPRHVHVRMHGATPPNTYRLTMREKLFHGVEAIRLTPVGEGNMFGRAGILAHTYMLGPSGQSNGCVSFRDYPKFLAAFKRGEVERIVVVAKLDKPPAFAKVEPENKLASLWKLFGVENKN
jgi:hypothetical protein